MILNTSLGPAAAVLINCQTALIKQGAALKSGFDGKREIRFFCAVQQYMGVVVLKSVISPLPKIRARISGNELPDPAEFHIRLGSENHLAFSG